MKKRFTEEQIIGILRESERPGTEIRTLVRRHNVTEQCLNREWFRDAREARIIIERWRQFYNHQRPHSSIGYRTPAKARQDWINEGNIDPRLTA